jgi:L,D-transpeptidase catalytic domain
MYGYRNGVHIGRSTASTGKPGKTTPTGVFTVLQKKVRHELSIHKGAQMPHMQRLTWIASRYTWETCPAMQLQRVD